MSYFSQWRARFRNLTVMQVVEQRDKVCQFWGHVWDRWPGSHVASLVGTPTICHGPCLVVNTRPDVPLDELHCTLICERHWDWLVQHPDIAASIGVAHICNGDSE
jgi:hypothetical protein